MSENVAGLRLFVESSGVNNATRDLDNFTRSGAKAERATDSLGSSFGSLKGMIAGVIAPLAGVVSVTAAIGKLTSVTREFDILNAGLKTATGSAENAEIAFMAIQDFATRTPYDLQQVTGAFTKLVNYGLTPSSEALTSYGDTAAAMGKGLDQMVEAVADAATGEFERLKEFGIKASKEGDQVTFTFRGVKTVVKNTAADIERYLIDMGKSNFGGAMADRMDSLDGALSNLGDAWNQFWLEVSKQGSGNMIEQVVRLGIDALTELTDMLASGQLSGYIDALIGKFKGLGEDIYKGFEEASGLIDQVFKSWGSSGSAAVDWILDAFKNMPENVRASLKGIGTWLGYTFESVKLQIGTIIDVIKIKFEELLAKAVATGREIADRLNPLDGDTFDWAAAMAAAEESAQTRIEAVYKKRDLLLGDYRQLYEEQITSIMDERDASLQAFEDQINSADALRKKYDELKAARQASSTDELAQFKIKTPDTGEASAVIDKKAEAELERIREQLMTEEEAIEASYQKRKRIILESTTITEKERGELMARLEKEHQSQLKALTMERYKTALSAFDDFEQNMLVLSKTKSKALAGIYKASAIANTVVKTYESATSAYAAMASIPYVGPALGIAAAAAAVAAGLANVAAIKAQPVGAYEHGGAIPGGRSGIVGEAGAEEIFGPAIVTSARTTADRMANEAEGQANTSPNITQHFTFGSNVDPVQMRKFASDIQQATMTGFMDAMSRGGGFRKSVRGAA